MDNFNKDQHTTPDSFDEQLKTTEPVVVPSETFVDTTMEQVEAQPKHGRRRWMPGVILGSLGAAVAAVAVVALLVIPGTANHSAVPSTTASAVPTSTVQTSDLTSALNDASQAVDQSSADQQATDTSLNDTNSQVAVPTE